MYIYIYISLDSLYKNDPNTPKISALINNLIEKCTYAHKSLRPLTSDGFNLFQ